MREEEKKLSSRIRSLKRFFKRRWVYPAIYIAAAAIILTSVLYLLNREVENKEQEQSYDEHSTRMTEEDAVEVNVPYETFAWPVADPDEVEIATPFYEATAAPEEQEAALLYYGNSFQPNTGIDIVAKNGETFAVQAAMSGTVVSVEEDALLGNVIVIEHADGVKTVYSAVEDILVKEGDKVVQGQKLANAGRSLLNEEADVHTHFEIRKNDKPVNPLAYFEKSLETLLNADEEGQNVAEEESEREDQSSDDQKEES
ncbi:MAG: M23 family metallopeptidase [Caldibacillus sp.]